MASLNYQDQQSIWKNLRDLGGGSGFTMPTYVPVTPLGALEGVKGDLIMPIVAVGVAIFLLVLIVMAVKAALAWKLSLLKDLSKDKDKFRRDINSSGGPPGEDQLNRWMNMFNSAMQSEACAKNVICRIGEMVKTQESVPTFLRMVEAVVPDSVHGSIEILRSSAEGNIKDCNKSFVCDSSNPSSSSSSTTTTSTTPAPPAPGQSNKLR